MRGVLCEKVFVWFVEMTKNVSYICFGMNIGNRDIYREVVNEVHEALQLWFHFYILHI